MNREEIQTIARDVPALVEGTRELTAAVEADRAQRRREDRRVKLAIIVGMILIITLTLLAVTNRLVLTRLADCTELGGGCYQQGQQRTSDAVAAIIARQTENNLRIANCMLAENKSGDPLRKCVERAIKASG